MIWLTTLLVLIGIFVVPFILSNYLAKSWRVPDSATGMGVILSALLAAGSVIFVAMQPEKPITYTVQEDDTVESIIGQFDGLGIRTLIDENNLASATDLTPGKELRIPNPKRLEIKRGVDLSGGVILIYEVDEEKTAAAAGAEDGKAAKVDIDALVQALAKRINPGGVKEVVIRPYGDKQVEIIVPDVDDAEVERLKRQITKAGFLKFLIMASRVDNPQLASLAGIQQGARVVKDGTGKPLGEWVPIARTEDGTKLKDVFIDTVNLQRSPRPGVIEVLMKYDLYKVEGQHLGRVSSGMDENLAPAIDFSMTTRGAGLFRGLTTTNLPNEQTGRRARLGIIMDNELISAPSINSTISDRGQISGSFTEDEVTEMVNVLNAGRLPAVLQTDPITENRIDPLLGADTIRKGGLAILGSLIAVLVFMAIYYRFAGIVACFALLLNLMLIVALMIIIRGAFTLPGLAGLVLTVGMSVDANVLIFERIREELKRGAGLRMAIRNGFARATTTIVDANITTLITAVVLYVIGTDQLKGFAVTLILGILMSMFTAIYCSRVIFEVAERMRWLKKMTMTQLLDEPKLSLLSMRRTAAIASIVLICVGLVAVGARWKGMLDIDFLGGTSVQARLKQPMPYSDVWSKLEGIADDVSLTQVNTSGEANTFYKVDTSITDNKVLQQKLADTFKTADGESMFVTHTVKFDPPTAGRVATPTATVDPATILPPSTSGTESSIAGPPAEENPSEPAEIINETIDETATDPPVDDAAKPATTDGSRTDLPNENVLAFADDIRVAQVDPNTSIGAPAADGQSFSSTVLEFEQRVTRDTLIDSLGAACLAKNIAEPSWNLTGPQGQADSAAGFTSWNVEAPLPPGTLGSVLGEMKSSLESRPAWLSSSKIGGKVAGDTKNKALLAMFVSLVCIVGYLWIRFQRVIFGLSAVVALVHDVLITLGVIGLSLYLSKVFGFLMIDEFKISLPIVAAFLTIIGYSLNDTIVVFDRIREVRGRSPDISEAMINTSINQTLSRTILTSLTTLIVVMILFVFGGQGIHGFAFALLVGVVVGTYSSIFIASPALLWMSKWQDESEEKAKKQKKKVGAA